MKEKGEPICPRCKINPRSKIKNPTTGKLFNPYCKDCLRERDKSRDRKKVHSLPFSLHELCPACQKNKIKKGRRFCKACYSQAEQTRIWCVIAFKIEELADYVKTNVDFPPELTRQAETRIKDGMSLLNHLLKEVRQKGE